MKNLIIKNYLNLINKSFNNGNDLKFDNLYKLITQTIESKNSIYICGNGGSAANSIHIANDFMYLSNKLKKINKIYIESLAANTSIITCIANDIKYDDIYSFQVDKKAKEKDLLIILSGSGNSKNILNAIKVAKKNKLNTFGIIGFDGGKSKKILDQYMHFNISDMQAVEDLQTIVFHLIIKKFLAE